MKAAHVDETMMRQMLEHLPFFAVLVGRDRRFLWVNRLDPTLEPEQVLGHRVDEFIHESDLARALGVIEECFDTGAIAHYEARAYGTGEMSSWYGTTVVPLPSRIPGQERALLLSNDVTKQHVAEAALRESENRFRMLTESSPDLIMIADHVQRVLYLNREPPQAAGFTRDDIRGRTIAELTHTSDAERARAVVQGVLETGVPASYEARGLNDALRYLCRVVRLTEEGGGQALIISTDVTAEREAEAARLALESQLQQAQKMETVGQLAGGVAHDFNNLLLVIQTHVKFARTALDEGMDASSELAAIETATHRAQELTRGLLTIGRRQPHEPRVLVLESFVRDGIKLLRRMIPESIDVELELREDATSVHADLTQLQQILFNLCLNARDAIAGSGTITVSVQRCLDPEEHAEARAEVTVRDNGSGMDAATLSRAFEPFFTTKPAGRGTGLGLSVVHSLVIQNGGTISLESAVGAGTTARVLLPVYRGPEPHARPTATQREAAAGSGTVLVVEDEPMVRRIVTRVLERGGYRVLQAEDGARALEVFELQADEIDLIILDAVMPKLGGKDTYDRIVRLRPESKVLFTTGYAAETLPDDFLRTRGLAVLHKPYSPETLLDTVARVLRG